MYLLCWKNRRQFFLEIKIFTWVQLLDLHGPSEVTEANEAK